VLIPQFGVRSYALLSRPPLVSEEQAPPVTARLACIRHAASVHPEPGSNSPKKELILTFFTSCKLLATRAKACLKTIQNELTLICTIQFLMCFLEGASKDFLKKLSSS
jgi:hypothetical protein